MLQIIFLSVVNAVGVISATLCAPALPYIADHFNVGYANIQFTLSLFLIGSALGQFLSGALADQVGQKFVMRAGLFLYIAASCIAALAQDMSLLLAARFFQGMGAAVGPVLARAITAELFPRDSSAKVQSYAALMIGATSMVAILCSGYLSLISWRHTFWLAALFGLVLFLWSRSALKNLPEKVSGNTFVFANVLRVFQEASFVKNVLVHTMTYGLMYGYIGLFPFLLKEFFHESNSMQVGIYSVGMIACYMCGALFSSRVVTSLGTERLLFLGIALQCSGGGVLFLSSSVFGFLFGLMLFNFSIGVILPTTIASALAPFAGQSVGAASAALGLTYRFLGALLSSILCALPLMHGASLGFSLCVLSFCSLGLLVYKSSKDYVKN